ncbi:MAG: hypothetical protein WCS92_00500 [Candidatus Babeliales bacterium]|jgi:hypothetical protein|nr:MAG: hypothetical protein US22_C0021G0005 [candidate division TM6 bacterium GW2011_GWF2_36_6]
MNIKQLSVLLLAVSMVAVQSTRAMIEEETVAAETTKKGFNQPQCDASGKPIRTAAKKQRKDKTKDVKAKAGASKKKATKAKKAKGKKVVKDKKLKRTKKDATIAKLGKFNRRGEIKSFTVAANNIIEFMNENATKATATQKAQLFTMIARFNWITGRKGFDTLAHYAQTVKLLQTASEHDALFGTVKNKFISKWLVAKETQLKDPSKMKAGKAVKKEKTKAKTKLAKKVKKSEKKTTAAERAKISRVEKQNK